VSVIPRTVLKSGLYLVSVPIGNLQDITLRALDTLKKLDKIYCEDTRVTRKLLGLYQITPPPLIRCDDVSQESVMHTIKDDIHKGLAVGLVSDAGTPLISDPGYVIITALRKEKLPIYPIAGVCAAIAAVSVSGLPTFSFQFMGFVPKKKKQRLDIINIMHTTPNTYIFYERPERIIDFLNEFPENLQEAQCFVAREMTKIHEEYFFGTITQALEMLATMTLKGEAVLIIATHNIKIDNQIDMTTEILKYLQQGKSIKDISRDTTLLKYASRNDLYDMAQKLKNND
jgi:16S rRNA (cytidine1402-2'-O)-methyltransferase